MPQCGIQTESAPGTPPGMGRTGVELDELKAVEGVRQLHARYGDAVFRKDFAAFADCWTDDAEWRIAGRVLRGKAEIGGFLELAMANFHRVIMTFRTPMVELTGPGRLRSRVQVTERNGFRNGRPGSTIGTYFEELEEGGGRWRRRWALFQLHYMGPADLTGDYFEQPDFGPPPGFPPPDAIAPDYSKLTAS
jgi:ketosteroid isomerase-like protein